jgi:hypothetical protein
MHDQNNIESRFVELIHRLAESKRAQWARSKHEKGFIYCFAGDDLIVFEVRGGANAEPVEPEDGVNGIVAKCRNTTYLWLEPSSGFMTLLDLLKKAPEDEEKFIQFRRRAHAIPLQILEALL